MERAERDWSRADELDALVAAPEHHRLLLENDRVRVLVTSIAAGETTAVHTHRWPNVQYIVRSADFVRRDGDGLVVHDTRVDGGPPEAGSVHWSEPIPPHSLENVGAGELDVIMVELKPPGPA